MASGRGCRPDALPGPVCWGMLPIDTASTPAPAPELPRPARETILVLCLLQALLLHGLLHWVDPAPLLRPLFIAWVLALPVPVLLAVEQVRDRSLWWGAGGLALLVLALGTAVYLLRVAPAPDSVQSGLWWPYFITLGLLLFIALPWLQGRIQHGRWHVPYATLFLRAWQNALTLCTAHLFVGLCWTVLGLWAGLFMLVKVSLFAETFAQPLFIALATGAMTGVGLVMGRSQGRTMAALLQGLLALFRLLLPLLATVVVLFVLFLPFTGVEPLWSTRQAARLLMAVLLVQLLFINAVYQDGRLAQPPYPRPLARLVEASLLAMPVLAVLALTALGLRLQQHGFTAARLGGLVVALVLAAYALGYAVAAARSLWTDHRMPRTSDLWHTPGPWLAAIAPVNRHLSWVVLALLVLLQTPVLDPYRLGAASQRDRLLAQATAPTAEQLIDLRLGHGPHGPAALQAVAAAHAGLQDAAGRQQVAAVMEMQSRSQGRRSPRLDTVAQAQAHITLATGHTSPDAAWWQALLAPDNHRRECLRPSQACVLLQQDLDGDQVPEVLLCPLVQHRMRCELYQHRSTDAPWTHAGQLVWSTGETATDTQALHQGLRDGVLQRQQPRWPEVRISNHTNTFSAQVQP